MPHNPSVPLLPLQHSVLQLLSYADATYGYHFEPIERTISNSSDPPSLRPGSSYHLPPERPQICHQRFKPFHPGSGEEGTESSDLVLLPLQISLGLLEPSSPFQQLNAVVMELLQQILVMLHAFVKDLKSSQQCFLLFDELLFTSLEFVVFGVSLPECLGSLK